MTLYCHRKAAALYILLSLSAAACSTGKATTSVPETTPAPSTASTPKQQPLSPPGSTELALNGKKISIKYSRPSMRGRTIMGKLVPWNQVWRTGANEATSLTTEADLVIGNVTVPAGSYTVYTLPSEKSWKLIINKQTGQWGTEYDQSQDLARIDMDVKQSPSPVEQFTISLVKSSDTGGVLKLEWENTSASVNFKLK
ncbi:MAG TPA: DUF2911 domain-containing protein [Blastocatellia bacterium]|nr:DUF2911 domain-containing protein [Blastocatellia bacterium]